MWRREPSRILVFAWVCFVSGCLPRGSSHFDVRRVDSGLQTDLSGRWNDTGRAGVRLAGGRIGPGALVEVGRGRASHGRVGLAGK